MKNRNKEQNKTHQKPENSFSANFLDLLRKEKLKVAGQSNQSKK
jgi:hypothetical protein